MAAEKRIKMLSITSDYVKSTGNPEPYLRQIADAGFSHIHWCHQWNTDFIYSQSEIDQIATWFSNYHLCLLDLHASHGHEKNWGSLHEYARLAGVELIKNRIHMATFLGSDVIILHIPDIPGSDSQNLTAWLTAVRKSLDELAPFAQGRGIKIAIENMANDNFERINQLFSYYGPEFLGLCYDAGHGNIGMGQGLVHLDQVKHRLISVHLHDNDGSSDQHNLLFSGTVDWERLARVIAASSYSKCVSMEVSMFNSGIKDERHFLERAFRTGETFSHMVAKYRV
jgi:sugar phosphate isomerase/epimerase